MKKNIPFTYQKTMQENITDDNYEQNHSAAC